MSERSAKAELQESHEILMNVLPLVRHAGMLGLQMQREILRIDTKTDGSPVTAADRAVESFLDSHLSKLYPGDGFEGEEDTFRESQSGRKWIVDPIDGTVQFIRGQEFWSTLVALEDENGGRVGVVAFPARNELIYASRGGGCWEETSQGARQLAVSSVGDLANSYVLHNGVAFAAKAKRESALSNLLSGVGAERGYADAFGHAEVIRGKSDVMIDFLTEPHDIAAIRIAVTEAGGRWSTFDGTEVLDPNSAGSITTNGQLHDVVLRNLQGSDDS